MSTNPFEKKEEKDPVESWSPPSYSQDKQEEKPKEDDKPVEIPKEVVDAHRELPELVKEELPQDSKNILNAAEGNEKEIKPVVQDVVKPNPRLSRKMEILAKHGGLESNVPINSEYWKLKS